jgi:hypothetical protein
MTIEPWINAEPLWDKLDPAMREVLRRAIEGNPEVRKGRDRWAADKDVAWRALFAEPSSRAIADVLRFYPSEQRADATLLMFKHIESDDLFWSAVAEHWSGFDAIDHLEFEKEFRKRKAAWSPACMSANDQAAYHALPKSFTIYRGQDKSDVVKNSWTLDSEVAEGFAKGHRGIRNACPVVLTAITTKGNVALFLNDRSEAEIVLFRRVKTPRPVVAAG